ncbi:TetR/AcrR family transcriptional regulator [uncultured Clostridium sp.]|uniref:TetR/AcrR family transcriptional regulator n=1 Tax=uncultured Clostridium sp. TaxID=59620 RepID=UPI002631E781|nr:TetR/AcrR family transcriptional regulator [uncultured Clostridium sp.]
MGTTVEKNKREKEQKLYKGAYDLFLEQGIENTRVDQIAKKAGVAKGTFYLYFEDKHDLIKKLIHRKSYKLAKEGLEKTRDMHFEKFEDSIIYFINYIIEYLKENRLMLKIITKNFSNGLYTDKGDKNLEGIEEVNSILEIFISNLKKKGYSEEESRLTLYMIIELVGSIAYNSIIFNEPTDIDSIKPILFKKIIGMIN